MTIVAPRTPNTALKLPTDEGVLLVQGEDRPGLVRATSSALAENGVNIVSLDQYTDDPEGGNFFQRTVFHVDDYAAVRPVLEQSLQDALGKGLGLTWTLSDRSAPKRVAILASTSDHCLLDLLWRQRRGEIPMTVPMVVSNHTAVADDVRSFGIPFVHVPSQGADKSDAEARILDLLVGNVDLVVLARYMQILSEDFLQKVGVPVINIHHSFLPAFIGAGPYRKAKERGVKLIGATAHYVTGDLDEGPIIEQDVVRVTHADTAADLQRRGADVERAVLARAVTWHCQDRVMRNGRETVVF
ncbi:formyltetrahydrofolate deformylase [Microbacterium invictum]|uniref:Formyltetrahydrofolate deformylase n=1 Tax=Microbacterium invictum TaxID=515415 RepID=A0AA40VMI5_9MICO|nr:MULTISPECIES: formyltetrahydrofolate deformylase [Microbacterium]MBB4140489.1 formyltetrahydrofolate deformylase [Microbacterium invictum]